MTQTKRKPVKDPEPTEREVKIDKARGIITQIGQLADLAKSDASGMGDYATLTQIVTRIEYLVERWEMEILPGEST